MTSGPRNASYEQDMTLRMNKASTVRTIGLCMIAILIAGGFLRLGHVDHEGRLDALERAWKAITVVCNLFGVFLAVAGHMKLRQLRAELLAHKIKQM